MDNYNDDDTHLDFPKEVWWKIFFLVLSRHNDDDTLLLNTHEQIGIISRTCDYWKTITTKNKTFTQLLFKKYSTVFDNAKVKGEKECRDLNYKMGEHETSLKIQSIIEYRKIDKECIIPVPTLAPEFIKEIELNNDDIIQENFQKRMQEYNDVIDKDKLCEERKTRSGKQFIEPDVKDSISKEEFKDKMKTLLQEREDSLFEPIIKHESDPKPYINNDELY